MVLRRGSAFFLKSSGRWPFGPVQVFAANRCWAKTRLSWLTSMIGLAMTNECWLLVGGMLMVLILDRKNEIQLHTSLFWMVKK
jgi:hypothetical protein